MINSALVEVTAPNAFQVVPSVEYCHVPFPVLEVIAIPLDGLVSTSAHEAEVKIDEAVVPAEVVFSFVPVKETVAALVMVGASLTAVTVIEATSVAVLNAVVVPLVELSTFVPNVPEV